MSETVKSFIGRVAVVEQEGNTVRVLLNEGETMYAARDLLAACGCAYPTKWCQREVKSDSDVELVKLPFPVNGKTGGASRRSVPDVLRDRTLRANDLGHLRVQQRNESVDRGQGIRLQTGQA